MATGTPEAAFAELREKRQASAAGAAAQRWKDATLRKAGGQTAKDEKVSAAAVVQRLQAKLALTPS